MGLLFCLHLLYVTISASALDTLTEMPISLRPGPRLSFMNENFQGTWWLYYIYFGQTLQNLFPYILITKYVHSFWDNKSHKSSNFILSIPLCNQVVSDKQVSVSSASLKLHMSPCSIILVMYMLPLCNCTDNHNCPYDVHSIIMECLHVNWRALTPCRLNLVALNEFQAKSAI